MNYPQLTDHEWEVVLDRLVLYAHRRYLRLSWLGVSGSRGGVAPGGIDASDLAADAIIDVIEGKRTWNRSVEPDFQRFLRSVVDSKMGHLARSLENRSVRRAGGGDGDRGGIESALPGKGVRPDAPLTEQEEWSRLEGLVQTVTDGDQLARRVVECLKEDITRPAEIAARLGVDVHDIYNTQKRLRNRLESVLKTQPGGIA